MACFEPAPSGVVSEFSAVSVPSWDSQPLPCAEKFPYADMLNDKPDKGTVAT